MTVALGDMTATKVDAYIIPHFCNAGHIGGVAAAVRDSGGAQGIQTFVDYVMKQPDGKLPSGMAVLTDSGGGNAAYHLHVTTVGTSVTAVVGSTVLVPENAAQIESGVIKSALLQALKMAEKHNMERIAAPALGTGPAGELNAEQSAKTMMAAVDEHMKEGGKGMEIVFAVMDIATFRIFREVLANETFRVLERKFTDMAREHKTEGWALGNHN